MNGGFLLVCLSLFVVVGAKYTPIVIYHGLGDHCCSANMMNLISKIQSALPGVFIHSIKIGKTPEEDRKKSLLDNMNRQIKEVCEQLAGIDELKDGFNAIGLSQGGQFLRAYVQRCNSPRVKRLITLGSQHQGVMSLPGCKESSSASSLEVSSSSVAESQSYWDVFTTPSRESWFSRSPVGRVYHYFKEIIENDPECSWWKQLVKLGVYSPIVRSQVVQAQYFKDPRNLEGYLRHNEFLLDINNDQTDSARWSRKYAENLASVDALYLYIFEEDTVVVPKESGWFGVFDPRDGRIKFLSEQPSLYQEDRLGLKRLAERGALYFRKLPGGHLKLTPDFIKGELADILK